MMVDFVTVEFDAELPGLIRAGTLVSVKEDGEVEFEVSKRVTVEGSHSSSVQIRAATPNRLEVSGNLAKFLQGHNLWGPHNLRELIDAFLARIQPQFWPDGMPFIDVVGGRLSRVDCTSGFMLDSCGDVLTWLRAAESRGNIDRIGQGRIFVDKKTSAASTLVYGDSTGKRAKNWQLTFYAKGIEIAKHKLPLLMQQRPDVIDWCNRLLRAEVRLRTGELKRRGLLAVGDWSDGTCGAEWREKMDRLQFAEGEVMACSDFEGVKPRLLDCYDAWQAGRDLRIGRKKSSFYRLRREMREQFGVDIRNTAPKSNVVPLRRMIVANELAQRPPWADEIARLLAA